MPASRPPSKARPAGNSSFNTARPLAEFCMMALLVMSAAALLSENPKPSADDIRHYLEGNICRCTGYHNIVKAVLAASGQDVSAVAAE